ncbi:MAG: cytochrome P450, partial [Anaerolineae bacterium]|nr:cytochrome P450 [Anaerolineae bacterium]
MATLPLPHPPTIPILGWRAHALRLFSDSARFPREWQRRYGNLINLGAGKGGGLLAFGAEYNRQVFTQPDVFYTIDAETFPVRLPPDSALFRMWNSGLLQMNGARHDQQRRLMMPALHKGRIEAYRADMIALTERQMGDWKAGETRLLLKEMRELTASIAIQTLMGLKPEDEGAPLLRMFETWSNGIQSPLTMAAPFDLPGLPFRRIMRLSEQIEADMLALLARKRQTAQDSGDAFSMLIQAQDEDGSRMSDSELIGQALTLFVAGHETTASALTWALFLLSQHPRTMAALAGELAPLNGDAPTPEQWNQFPILDGVIQETLRLFPPLPIVSRASTAPFEMGGHHFPARTGVILSAFVTHRMADSFPQPDRFLPERWASIDPSPYEYIPFS